MKYSEKEDPKRRVVITGLGVVSSIGIGVEEFWKNLIAGKSGISEIEAFDTSAYPTHKGGEVKNFKPENFIDKRKLKHLGRASQLAIAAAKLAIHDSGLSQKDITKAGVILGTTMGESQILEELDKAWITHGEDNLTQGLITSYLTNNLSVNTAIELGATGFNAVMPTACSSGNYAIGYSFDLIRTGHSELMFCGGSDAFSRIAFTGFNRLLAMAPEKCQPFDKNRRGMMLGEGAGILILESLYHAEKRKANIYAEVLGYGLGCDAHHMTQPSEEGIVNCMEKAIKEAKISKEDVDYISAHGTGTPQNDKTECAAIKKVFGKNYKTIPCSSIKSMLGHTMGAASAIEAMSCCFAIRDKIAPPTINYDTLDKECAIDCVPNEARKINIRVAVNNSSAFGGNNACLVLAFPTSYK
ncbi:MAG: 3-oxoacyl-ACP synthase [Candidatus Omnitrophica bacterium CG_4_10_14_0_8_um_filter_44_12]|nr:MAG: 3-oxoacyl-ACP synthase [Candidatus Omnitrophica bacterium CG_4_10_14_0_8_um_filter_44_12]